MSKVGRPGLGDILEYLIDRELLEVTTVVLIARLQPWVEISFGLAALTVLKTPRAEWAARAMAVLYFIFALLILAVSEGRLLLPLDCGCFEIGTSLPAILPLARNVLIGTLLLLFRAGDLPAVWKALTGRGRRAGR